MTKTEIETLSVGDSLQTTMDIEAFTAFTKLKPNARYSKARKITEIAFRGINVDGKVFVGGYTEYGGNGSTISFSFTEGEVHYRKEV